MREHNGLMPGIDLLAKKLQDDAYKIVEQNESGIFKNSSLWSVSNHNNEMYIRETEFRNLKDIDLADEIKQLDSYKQLVDVLKTDSIYGRKIDKQLTTYGISGGVNAETYIGHVLVKTDDLLSKGKYNKPKHRAEFLAELTAQSSKVRLLTPILGMRATRRINLVSNAQIIPRNHEYMAKCLNWELIKNSFARMNTYWVGPHHAGVAFLVTEFDAPVLTDATYSPAQNENNSKSIANHEWIRQTLQYTFDLHGYEVNLGKTLVTSTYKAAPTESISNPRATPEVWPFSNSLQVKGSLGRRLNATFKVLDNGKSKSNKMLRLSTKRIAIARHRDDEEDSFIDLMIACEAFYMFNESDHIDIGYKLRLRAAVWYEGGDFTPTELMQLFSIAYDYRSRIAHGDEIQLKKFRGQNITMKSLFEYIEKILKSGLLKYIKHISHKPDNYRHDWESFVLKYHS